jgi:hypothetical protein
MHTKFWLENLKGVHHFLRPRSSQEDNIRIDLEKLDCEGVDWTHPTENRVHWH